MNLYIVFALVSFLASVVGSVCGIGGGVLIKPVLDTFGVLDVAAISFLSGCTVFSMSCYSVVKARINGSSLVDRKIGFPLAVGAVLGGLIGKTIFQYIFGLVTSKERVGAVQAACLLFITLLTFLYTLNKDKIKKYHISNVPACIAIGIVLGFFSAFLGIGGGPINLMVLFFFISKVVFLSFSSPYSESVPSNLNFDRFCISFNPVSFKNTSTRTLSLFEFILTTRNAFG